MTDEQLEQPVLEINAPAEEYAALKEDFAQIIDRGIRGFQEKTPGRGIENVIMRLQGRYGLIVQTNSRGLIEVPEMSGMEMDNQGRMKRQRMTMGMNCSVSTKGTTFGSLNVLKRGETTIKEFEVNSGAHELLKACIERAQSKGEALQQKIEDDGELYFDRLKNNEKLITSINWDIEDKISMDQIFHLVTLARQTLKMELGAKLAESEIIFFHIVDTMEITDSTGNKIDTIVPRTGFTIQAKTDKGNSLFDTVRGTGGMGAIVRHHPDQLPETVIENLAKNVAKHCRDMDRAQPCSILEDEACIVLSGAVSGILAHEVYGHPSEADIVISNKRNKEVDLNLKARLGGQVSENNQFSIIDDGSSSVQLGSRVITNCFGACAVDEEGTPVKRTSLVTNGIQTLFMNSADTIGEILDGLPEAIAEPMKTHNLTGNLRNERFDKRPLVRMTNTFILPNPEGPKTIEEMATLVPRKKKAVYLVTCSGGWVQTETGNFEVTGQLGYLIENGIITDKPVKDVIVRGNITKFGSKILAIGSDETVDAGSGYCGKERQWVPVELGGPALLIEDAAVGAEVRGWSWHEAYKEYDRQMREVASGKRKPSEVYFRFIEEASKDEPQGHHSSVCLVATCLPVKDEIELLTGLRSDTSTFIIGDEGKIEER